MKIKKEGYTVNWCIIHKRIANSEDVRNKSFRCDPKLGGITMPCKVVQAEITWIIIEKEPSDS